MKPETEVWFCPNGAWVTYTPEGYDDFIPCGALCDVTTYGSLPVWAQREVDSIAGEIGDTDLCSTCEGSQGQMVDGEWQECHCQL